MEHSRGLAGHSDADVVLHAVTDALLGAAGLGDIGDAYPDTDPQWQDVDSATIPHRETLARLTALGWSPVNLDVTVFAQEPKLGPVKAAIRDSLLPGWWGCRPDAVNVKAKTGERVGHIGRGEALGCHAVALIRKSQGLRGHGSWRRRPRVSGTRRLKARLARRPPRLLARGRLVRLTPEG